MSRRLTSALLLCLALALGALLAGCGHEEEELHAVEGEPLELGELSYNVQITRFLNPSNADDATYLRDLDEAPPGEEYLAVFMRINNNSEDHTERIPTSFTVETSRDEDFSPLDLDNPFALELGAEIEPGGSVPAPDTAARSGPIKGSMVLFLVEQEATENRPLELLIPGPDGETGTIELDI